MERTRFNFARTGGYRAQITLLHPLLTLWHKIGRKSRAVANFPFWVHCFKTLDHPHFHMGKVILQDLTLNCQ